MLEAEWERSDEFHEAWKLKVRHMVLMGMCAWMSCVRGRMGALRRVHEAWKLKVRHIVRNVAWKHVCMDVMGCAPAPTVPQATDCITMLGKQGSRVYKPHGFCVDLAPPCRRTTCWRTRSDARGIKV